MQLKTVIWLLIWLLAFGILSGGAIVNATPAHRRRVRGHLAKRAYGDGSSNSRWTFFADGL